MNIQLLIDAVVRQTTVLIAQLATAGGVRAPLAHVANQVFLELAQELEAQGVSRKVSADMFGMALRAYLKKIQRLSESSTDRGRSLWEVVLEYLSQGGVRTKGEVLMRFARDDEALVRGVLHDLVESGLVFSAGTAGGSVFRATTPEERGATLRGASGLEEFVWVLIYREGPLSEQRLLQLAGNATDATLAALHHLKEQGRVTVEEGYLTAKEFLVPLGSSAGWEAAVYDHYQAVVRTLISRLKQVADGARAADETGGSTYTFEVWPGHPQHGEVVGTLAAMRKKLGALRSAADEYNQEHVRPPDSKSVVVYVGQCVTEEQSSEEVKQ